MSMPFSTRARGKLLLSGEYFVLDGALALALPVRFGQALHVQTGAEPGVLHWRSLDEQGAPWFEARFALPSLDLLSATDDRTAATLRDMLLACRRQQAGFLSDAQGLAVVTQIDFPRNWGLGTSSTLIATLGKWAAADPYPVLFDTLGGSGYDIACAYAEGPLLYRLHAGRPEVQAIHFSPAFRDRLYFVHLSQKQDSREGIRRFRERAQGREDLIAQVSALTRQMLQATDLESFERVMKAHEQLVAEALDMPPVQERLFPDYPGAIKSLGAWGGDFVMVTGRGSPGEIRDYFESRGFPQLLPYTEMTDF